MKKLAFASIVLLAAMPVLADGLPNPPLVCSGSANTFDAPVTLTISNVDNGQVELVIAQDDQIPGNDWGSGNGGWGTPGNPGNGGSNNNGNNGPFLTAPGNSGWGTPAKELLRTRDVQLKVENQSTPGFEKITVVSTNPDLQLQISLEPPWGRGAEFEGPMMVALDGEPKLYQLKCHR